MSEEADIEDLPPPEEAAPKEVRPIGFKTLGLKTVALGVIIASLLGAGGGAMLSKTLQKPSVDIAPVIANLETIESENKSLKAQIARLQRDIKALPKPVATDLTPIQSRLSALESAKPREIDSDLVARLEALKEEGSEALDLSDILARIEALEARPIVAPKTAAPSRSAVMALEPFPEAAILAAIETSQPSGGWLKRSLKKHISVQSDDNPHYLVELIVENIENGNIESAAEAFDKLPAEAKAAGQAWRDSLAN